MKNNYELKHCPICGSGNAALLKYVETVDGRGDREAKIICNCGLTLTLTSKEYRDLEDKHHYTGGYMSDNKEFWNGMHQALVDKWNNMKCNNSTEPAEFGMNMKVKDLKVILDSIEDLELDGIKIDTDEMDVIIPVLDSDDPKFIHGFRHVRTAGILSNEYEPNLALCLSAPDDGLDMESQIHHNGFETQCEKVLF